MDQRHGAADLGVAQRSEPSTLCRRVTCDPGANDLDDEDVGQPRDHRLASRAKFARLGGDEAQRALDPLRFRRSPRVDGNPSR